MDTNPLFRDTSKIAKFATIVIFLALIRTISEPLRLQHYSKTMLTYDEIKPFLIGALTAALALLAMTILFYFNKNKMIVAACIVTIIVLLLEKKIYFIP
jgi:Zn-dependent protease with chaperone function